MEEESKYASGREGGSLISAAALAPLYAISKHAELKGSGMKSEPCYGKNKATLGVGECVHCGGLLAVKVKAGKGVYLKPYHRGDGLITGIANSVNPNNPLPPLPDAIKNIP